MSQLIPEWYDIPVVVDAEPLDAEPDHIGGSEIDDLDEQKNKDDSE